MRASGQSLRALGLFRTCIQCRGAGHITCEECDGEGENLPQIEETLVEEIEALGRDYHRLSDQATRLISLKPEYSTRYQEQLTIAIAEVRCLAQMTLAPHKMLVDALQKKAKGAPCLL